MGLPRWLNSKEYACSAGDVCQIPGLERSLGGINGNPFQYSCLEKPMDRRAWQATVHRVTKSRTCMTEHTHTGTQCLVHTHMFKKPN